MDAGLHRSDTAADLTKVTAELNIKNFGCFLKSLWLTGALILQAIHSYEEYNGNVKC